MQVHYNLLAGDEPDTVRRPAAAGARRRADLTPLHTCCCRPRSSCPAGPATTTARCATATPRSPTSRRASATGPGSTGDLLHLLCGGRADAGAGARRCTRTVDRADDDPRRRPATCTCSAARSRIEVNPGTPRARTVLDIPVWDFDNQGAKPIDAGAPRAGDTVKVTCRTSSGCATSCRPSRASPDRYVVWGEGTTDEMCLGMLQVAFDGEP